MKVLLEMRIKLVNILNQMKGFDVGYTTRVKDKIMVDYEGRRFIVSFEEVENPNEDMGKDIDTYIK